MQRSSESIGAIAGALAKAQAELTNPEKSLTATIRSPSSREGERTFRYASLSSGLDIVRKALGNHEIATVQTTSIDPETGLIRLTTMLAHSSGEWVSSDWPVCPVSETTAPHKMGTALTYARRYALFTLAGIAGDDDLDAPDLPFTNLQGGPASPNISGKINGHAEAARMPSTPRRGDDLNRKAPRAPMLDAEASSALAQRLASEIASLSSEGTAVEWARQKIGTKNTLTEEDAGSIEATFRERMQVLQTEPQSWNPAPSSDDLPPIAADTAAQPGSISPHNHSPAESGPLKGEPQKGSKRTRSPTVRRPKAEGIDKSGLVLMEPRRYRNRDHVRFVATQPCLVCGRQPSDPHHIRFAQKRALGRKVSDEFTVPLCRIHHRELHRTGDEAAWWNSVKIDPMPTALRLWQHSRGVALEADPRNAGTDQERTETETFRLEVFGPQLPRPPIA